MLIGQVDEQRESQTVKMERVVRGSSWAFGSFEAAGFIEGIPGPI